MSKSKRKKIVIGEEVEEQPQPDEFWCPVSGTTEKSPELLEVSGETEVSNGAECSEDTGLSTPTTASDLATKELDNSAKGSEEPEVSDCDWDKSFVGPSGNSGSEVVEPSEEIEPSLGKGLPSRELTGPMYWRAMTTLSIYIC